MTLLSQAFREQVKKTKDISQINEMTHSVAYSTGFLPLDFLNGHILEINNKQYFQVGVIDGSINAVIGRSGCGKTTWTLQAAGNIIRPFKSSCVFFDAAEVGTVLSRAMQLSGLNVDDFKKKFICRDAGITTESIYDRVKMIRDLKIENPDEYTYDTGIIDDYGAHIIKFEPTVYVVDSLKAVLPKKLADDQATNMAGAQTAKVNSDVFTRLVPMCREANIIMIIINHITTDVNISMMPKKSDLAFLKQGEKLPGGKTATYLQNNIFRLDEKSKLKNDAAFGIDGAIVTVSIVKSRTNKAGKDCFLLFDQDKGYDPDLSLFLLLKENNMLDGGGAYLRLPDSDIKFTQKGFKEKLYSNPEVYNKFISVCLDVLKRDLIARHESQKKEEQEKFNVVSPYQAILSQLNS